MGVRQQIPGRQTGFTLVEAMLAVTLLAILTALAMPSYRGFLTRAHRTEAIGQLMEVAACQERIRAGSGAYDPARCLPADSAHYDYRYVTRDDFNPNYFEAAAQPLGAQASDACGELRYDSLGFRAATGADPRHCWSAR